MSIDGYSGYDGDHPALELINSERWYGRGAGSEDVLHEPNWLRGYVERWGFDVVRPPTRRDLARLVALRSVLRSAYTAVASGAAVPARDLAAINAALGEVPLRRRIEAAGDGAYAVALEASVRDWRWVAAEVAASFAELVATGEHERMKLCENRECQCAFYDASKNRSRRWCYPEVCGNVNKVRQFRARRRAQSG